MSRGEEHDAAETKIGFDPKNAGLIFDSINSHLLAMLANAVWPTDNKKRMIVQKTPLVPLQGATLNCGLYSIYFVACMLLRKE